MRTLKLDYSSYCLTWCRVSVGNGGTPALTSLIALTSLLTTVTLPVTGDIVLVMLMR